MTDPVTIAAAYVLLFGQPAPAPVPLPIADTAIICQLPPAPQRTCPVGRDCDASGRPISGHVQIIRGDPPSRHWRHHRHCHRWGRGWRCR